MISKNKNNNEEIKQKIFIVPSTHWDREWYLPFQHFRFSLVKMIDQLLDIMENQDFFFMFDGQTIILEDYLEIRPERKDDILRFINEGKLAVGPLYLLPDEWLISGESIIRNLEISMDLAKELNIPLMEIAYLPDMFGHSRVIPQIMSDLTNFKAIVLWRGVGSDIVTVPFKWKSNPKSLSSMLGIYLPYGYGNAAELPEDKDAFQKTLIEKVSELKQYSPVPIYLLMNGTDHQFANPNLVSLINEVEIENSEIKLSLLNDFISETIKSIKETNYTIPEYAGEFRSSVRAPLLQDTYSTRMWIKQWNQKIEDKLSRYTEPLLTYTWFHLKREYPTSFLNLAWKWLIKNQTHDGICGCSVDQTHEEMKSRFSWSESIADSLISDTLNNLSGDVNAKVEDELLVYNPTNCSDLPIYLEFAYPSSKPIYGIKDENSITYPVQRLTSSDDVFFEQTFNPFMLKAGLKIMPGRKIIDFYINEVFLSDDMDSKTCNITLVCDKLPIGDFDVKKLKSDALELIESGKYKKFHVKATKELQQTYASLIPIDPWSFSKLEMIETRPLFPEEEEILVSKSNISTKHYEVKFNRDGTFDYSDKAHGEIYQNLHKFEDWGDKGDEYTFGRIGPEKAKISRVKRKIITHGPLFCEIKQTMKLKLFKELKKSRKKRIGKVTIPVSTIFRFYRDIPRIDIRTEFSNKAKDHRLRICFDLPFTSSETLTSTHFGVIKRESNPIEEEKYLEKPSGIQAQKGFIRIENPIGDSAFTLCNKGLPEIELYKGSRLALTLIRAVGYLSRSDFEERPMHAGPLLETPGAQELNKRYNFEYSIMIHSKKESIYASSDYAETFSFPARTIISKKSKHYENLTKPILKVDNKWIRISSLRVKGDKIRFILYNLDEEKQKAILRFNSQLKSIQQIKINGSIIEQEELSGNETEVAFNPFEIMMFEVV